MAYLLNYTREPMEDDMLYGPRLAYSMHLAVSRDGKEFRALNHNSGVLFVKATENEDGSLNPKSLKNPWLFTLPDGRFGIAGVRIQGDGGEDEESKGCVVLFTSKDLLEYEELGLLKLGTEYVERILVRSMPGNRKLHLSWQDRTGRYYTSEMDEPECLRLAKIPELCDKNSAPCCFEEGLPENVGIEGAVPHNMLEIVGQKDIQGDAVQEGTACGPLGKIPEDVVDRLCRKLLTPVNTGIEFPEHVEAEKLGEYRARALYSDGSFAWKKVDWDLSQVDFNTKGSYRMEGRVHQDHFAFPVAYNRADPCVTRWNGKYYFIATNDADGNHTLYIREADTIPGLVEAEEHLILDSKTYPGIGGLLWAPEFHEIEGRLYIFHAATPGEFFWEESHVMELREGGNPVCREDWSAPKRVVKCDGSNICEAGKEITLDMTCFAWQGEWYAVWSQRQFLPKDLGAWLYIAKLDKKEPWRLLTEPVVLSKPEYGWANNHTFVDEGPFALAREDKLYLTFSSAAVDATYVVGLLTIEKGMNLLEPGNWKKRNYPLLTSRSVEGEFGTGHNAYVTDEDGNVWNTYHARPGVEGVRSSGIRRVHFDADGDPVLDMTEELDVAEAYRLVTTEVIVG